MSGLVSLAEYVKELAFAAGPGAQNIKTTTVAAADLEAKTGIAANLPGPGLQSVLNRLPGHAPTSTDTATSGAGTAVPQVASRMAHSALNQGAALLSGGS
jgi:hypothetical protein